MIVNYLTMGRYGIVKNFIKPKSDLLLEISTRISVNKIHRRMFHESPNNLNTTLGNMDISNNGINSSRTGETSVSKIMDANSIAIKNITQEVGKYEFMKDLKISELLSYFVIGIATLNKPILDFCIKVFPYVPILIIKSLIYKIYCGGENIEEVKRTGLKLANRGISNMMISLTIEACEGNKNLDPEYIVDETIRSIKEILVPHTLTIIKESGKDINLIPPGYVALKPTGFVEDAANVLKYFKSDPKYAEKFEKLVDKAFRVCQTIYDTNIRLANEYPERISPFTVGVIDAEKYDLQEGVYELQRRLYSKFNKINKPISVIGTIQMYLSESSELLAKEEKLATANNYRLGLKLVRGAYLHSEKNRNTIIHETKESTDSNYNKGISYCIENILENKGNESTIGHLVVASHNADSLKLATNKIYCNQEAKDNKNKNNIVLGQLLGMADNITYQLIKSYKINNVIKYVPWGPPLETKEYLLRRLEENGDAVKTDNGYPLIKAIILTLFRRLFNFS